MWRTTIYNPQFNIRFIHRKSIYYSDAFCVKHISNTESVDLSIKINFTADDTAFKYAFDVTVCTAHKHKYKENEKNRRETAPEILDFEQDIIYTMVDRAAATRI